MTTRTSLILPAEAELPLALWTAMGYQPHAAQLQDHLVISPALRHVAGSPQYIDNTTGRQYGKTTEAAAVVLEGAFCPPDEVGPPTVKVIADTYEHTNLVWDQVEAYLFGSKDLAKTIDTAKPGKGYDRERWILYLKNGATIQKLSADRPQALTGHTISLAVIDEKAFVSDSAMEMLLPCLAVRRGRVVAYGTAEGVGWGRTWHYRGLDDDYPEHASLWHPSSDNPYLPPEAIQDARSKLTTTRFRQLWLAEFAGDEGTVFHNIDGCAMRGWPVESPPLGDHRYVMGVDLARYSDYTAIIVLDRDTRRCVYRARFNAADWSIQASRIAAVAKTYNNARVWCDTTHGSVGDVVADILRREYDLDLHGYEFTAPKKQRLIDDLVWALEREEVRFPADWKDLINELKLFEARPTAQGRTILSAPTGFHDDLVMALALANYGCRRGARETIVIPRTVGAWEGW